MKASLKQKFACLIHSAYTPAVAIQPVVRNFCKVSLYPPPLSFSLSVSHRHPPFLPPPLLPEECISTCMFSALSFLLMEEPDSIPVSFLSAFNLQWHRRELTFTVSIGILALLKGCSFVRQFWNWNTASTLELVEGCLFYILSEMSFLELWNMSL